MSTKTTAVLFREPPPGAPHQRRLMVDLSREAAKRGEGVSADLLRFEYGIRQAATRVWELKNLYGFQIETRQDPTTRVAVYHFLGDPPEGWPPPAKQARLGLNAELTVAMPKPEPHGTTTPAADSGDWFTEQTGKKRPLIAPETLFLWERRQ